MLLGGYNQIPESDTALTIKTEINNKHTVNYYMLNPRHQIRSLLYNTTANSDIGLQMMTSIERKLLETGDWTKSLTDSPLWILSLGD